MHITLLGATGHTGRLTVAALLARGVDVRACGRNRAALAHLAETHPGIETRRVDVKDAASVRDALHRSDAVANLAGPFLATGFLPVEAAIREGIPYADTTGEQAFMHEVSRRYGERARKEGVAVVNALAYEYAIGDLAARHFFPEGGDALHLLYRSRRAQGSAGTKKSILRVMGAPALAYESGTLQRVHAARFCHEFPTAEGIRTGISFAGGEVLTVPRHTPFATVRTYVPSRPSSARWMRLAAPAARLLLRGPILRAAESLVDMRHAPPRNTSATGEVRLLAQHGGGTRTAAIHMGDPYEATAEILAEGILRLPTADAIGVVAPAEAFEPQTFFETIGRRLDDFRLEPPHDV